MGDHQRKMFASGCPKEAELVCKKGSWYCNLVVEIPDTPQIRQGKVLGQDLTNIGDRIRAQKRERTRLHRWAFKQLQEFIVYKAENRGKS